MSPATGFTFVVPWVPSELNPSDGPSRGLPVSGDVSWTELERAIDEVAYFTLAADMGRNLELDEGESSATVTECDERLGPDRSDHGADEFDAADLEAIGAFDAGR